MGLFSDKVKYFQAYKSIKYVIERTHHMTGSVEDIYLINKESIPNYLRIINKDNILNKIEKCQRSEVNKIEEKLKDDFGKYELEKNIKILDVTENNYENFKNVEFIMVDKTFLLNMGLKEENEEKKKRKIIVNEEENEKIITIELSSEVPIIIEEQDQIGIYKFGELQEKGDFKGDSDNEEEEKKKEEIYDPEVYNDLRRPPADKQSNRAESRNNEEGEEKNVGGTNADNTNNDLINVSDGGNNINNNDNIINNQQKEEKKATIAELDKLINCIFSSLNNSEESHLEYIQKIINEVKLNNNLKENEESNLIQNIKTAIKKLSQRSNINQDLHNSSNINESSHTYYERSEYQNLLDDSLNESKINPQKQNNVFNNLNIKDPFNFSRVKIFQCDKCNNDVQNVDEIDIDHYTLKLNKECADLDACFKLKNKEQCSRCNQYYYEYSFKFKTTPEILIIIFEKPKENKNFIKFNMIGETIDLKKHLLSVNNLEKNEYRLIKALYVYDELNDPNLYVDIPQGKENNYIPYIIFYRKMKD